MPDIRPLDPRVLRPQCDPQQFSFGTTAELELLTEVVGQARALDAVEFGVGMKRDGYNLYALGPAGIGKHTIVQQVLEKHAREQPLADDWCYVHNFEDRQKPLSLHLPAGRGTQLRRDMELLVQELRTSIPEMLES
ncbi:MAG: Lon-like protease helical domain-containing protein, partial [Acidiferrobacterales bacterium]|nr:Lon-like protease helical domain-containing protein [Acidiferrobacterales bacterium]